LENTSTEVYNGFKDIVFEIANEVENVFSQTFETMECTSTVEFGWLRNKFADKPQDKKGKTKALK